MRKHSFQYPDRAPRGHSPTAEEVEAWNRKYEIGCAVAEAKAEVLNAQEQRAAEAEGRPVRVEHFPNGDAVMHEHTDGVIMQTNADGQNWLVTSGVGGLWYDGPDDLAGYYPE